jgi:hypothetical protein
MFPGEIGHVATAPVGDDDGKDDELARTALEDGLLGE